MLFQRSVFWFLIGLTSGILYTYHNLRVEDFHMPINWDFIGNLEKKHVLKGYVPMKNGRAIANSGVTISTGIDIGQMSEPGLYRLFSGHLISDRQLMDKLMFYAGLKGYEAIETLRDFPLEITLEESKLLEKLMKDREYRALSANWFKHTGSKFDDLPDEVQTVLFSLVWNLGSGLPKEYPNTWDSFVRSHKTKDWSIAYNFMSTFPSKNEELASRRRQEAEYLRPLTVLN